MRYTNLSKFAFLELKRRHVRLFVLVPSVKHSISSSYWNSLDDCSENTLKSVSSSGMTSKKFDLHDYDCIGLDMDNTLIKYNIEALVLVVFNGLCKYLIEEKGYDSKIKASLTREEKDFLQRGLIIDKPRGNLLKLYSNGKIVKACHGKRELDSDDLALHYGKDHRWDIAASFSTTLLRGQSERKLLHPLTDYFDLVCDVIFIRMVDQVDSRNVGKRIHDYSFVAEDLVDSLVDMFNWSNFSKNIGSYFPFLRENVANYIIPCSDNVKQWLNDLKKAGKIVFLITGSQWDYSKHLCEFALGRDFLNYFDVMVSSASKPAFFRADRPFIQLEGEMTGTVVDKSDMQRGKVYSCGNWQDLKEFFARIVGISNPRCVYIGDHAVQDIAAPLKFANLDVVACCEELLAEGLIELDRNHPAAEYLASSYWGSYFHGQVDGRKEQTLWGSVTHNYSKLVVPDIEYLASH